MGPEEDPNTILADSEGQLDGLRPAERLPLKEKRRVRITVEGEPDWAERTRELVCWPGDVATLERFAMDPEFDPFEDE